MRIGIVTPAPRGSRTGNRITALRWTGMLRSLGHDLALEQAWAGEDWDVLVALHARKSHGSIAGFHDRYPNRPVVVTLTGTDRYVDLTSGEASAQRSLEMASHLVVLQPLAARGIPGRVVVIRQSASPPTDPFPKRPDAFDVAVVGHLRPIKDPFLTARAAATLPAESRIHVVHMGRAMSPEMAAQARATTARYTWTGPLSHRETLRRLCGCRLLSLTSHSEGGANVLSEAIICGVPVLSTRIDGSVGMLGDDYPGFFEVGDADGLAQLLHRAERDAGFYAELQSACVALRPTFAPAKERQSWADLVASF